MQEFAGTFTIKYPDNQTGEEKFAADSLLDLLYQIGKEIETQEDAISFIFTVARKP